MIRDDGKAKLGLTVADYPLAEKRPDLVISAENTALADLTLEAVENGDATLEDFRITPRALRLQGEIAEAAGRPTLGRNFERAAELVEVPQATILQIYELLRPGRARSKAELLDAARLLREQYDARTMAGFIEQAAEVYERRGLFTYRF